MSKLVMSNHYVSTICFLGAEKAVAAGYAPISCMILGFITSVGGGFYGIFHLEIHPQCLKQEPYMQSQH